MARVRVVINAKGVAGLKNEVDVQVYQRVMPEMESDAKRFAPVDTGRLRKSIRARRLRQFRYELRASTDYAAFVELGHRIVAWGNDTGRRAAPQPYLRPAAYRRRG